MSDAENELPTDWITIDARRFGKFDANGEVMYECPLCDYVTGPHSDGSRLANEAKSNHMRDKHGRVLPPAVERDAMEDAMERIASWLLPELEQAQGVAEASAAIKRARVGSVDPRWEGLTADDRAAEAEVLRSLIEIVRAAMAGWRHSAPRTGDTDD